MRLDMRPLKPIHIMPRPVAVAGLFFKENSMKLLRLSDEGNKPVVVNAGEICFFQRTAPERVEINFVGGTKITVRGTVESVRIALEAVSSVVHDGALHHEVRVEPTATQN